MKFKHLKLATKQRIALGLVLLVMTAVHFYSIAKMEAIKGELDEVTSNRIPRAIAISDINLNAYALRVSQLQHTLTKSQAEREAGKDSIISLIDKINENRDLYERLKQEADQRALYAGTEQELYDTFDAKWADYQDLTIEFFQLYSSEQVDHADSLLNNEARQVFNSFSADLVELVELNERDSFAAAKRAELTLQSARKVSTSLIVITFLVAFLIAYWLIRYVTSRIGQLQMAAKQIASGDLDVNLDASSRDEIGSLAGSFNRMAKSLREATQRLTRQNIELENQKAETERKNRELEHTMSRLKNAQNQLVQSEKMASIGQLTAGIAHEINNPINFVSSNVSPLKRDVEDLITIISEYDSAIADNELASRFEQVEKLKRELDFQFLTAEISKLLEGIEVGAHRTTEIVRGLRNFSRLDENDMKLTDINQGIESTLLMLRNELKNRIEVIKDYGDIPQIQCYPGKLNQVFMNLLNNASQAIEGQGKIFIKTGYDGEIVTISFRDTGEGIPENIKNRIFDPFFTTKEIGQGTGLGLSITFGIIEEHDGNIEVFSEVGKGTEFRITLPAIH